MNHHQKPFDEGTLTKLDIFEKYAEAWLPTFIMLDDFKTIVIVDFFSGPGHDVNGVPGSPIRTLAVIRKFIGRIFKTQTKVIVYFNEYKKKKFKQLTDACNNYLEDNPLLKRAIEIGLLEINLLNQDFDNCFSDLYPKIAIYPSLVFLDQNGIKYLPYINRLEQLDKIDFLYFVSSSYLKRFSQEEEFINYFQFDKSEAEKQPYRFIHNILLEQIKAKLPTKTNLQIFPFSIRKGSNIYGLIFGAKSYRAVEKFLRLAWKTNPNNGSANFDIDDHANRNQINIFTKTPRLSKVESFQQRLEHYVKQAKSISNKDIYIYTLEQGHIPTHARLHLLKLKKDKKLTFDGRSPKIKFDSLTKKDDIVNIQWIK